MLISKRCHAQQMQYQLSVNMTPWKNYTVCSIKLEEIIYCLWQHLHHYAES